MPSRNCGQIAKSPQIAICEQARRVLSAQAARGRFPGDRRPDTPDGARWSALFHERAQEEAFSTRPFLAPAPLAPTGRGVSDGDGIRLTGRWSWANGVMDGNWIIVGALTLCMTVSRTALA